MSTFVLRYLGLIMKCDLARKLAAITVTLVSAGLHAADVDLTGSWIDERGQQATLVQDGNKVLEVSNDPAFTAFFGEHLFIATFDGTKLRGKVATALKPEFKEFCGKNWGSWVDFEMELSTDGNRMEGRWKKGTRITTQAGCPLTNVVWEPYMLVRTGPGLPSSPTKRYILGSLSLLGLALVSFLIRSAFENYLVSATKRAPNTASMASWSLFGGLLLGSAIGSVALAGSTYLALPLIVTLAVLSALCFVMCAVFSNKK